MKSFVKTLQTKYQTKNNEARLFCAIIFQAIEDADYQGLDKKFLKYKLEAIDWLTKVTDYFSLICEMAGFDPEYITDKIKQQMILGKYQFTQEQYDILFASGNLKRTILKLIP